MRSFWQRCYCCRSFSASGSSGGDGDSGSDDSGENSDDSSDTDTAPEPELSVTVTPGANETTAVTVENAEANQRVGVGFDDDTGSSGVNISRLNLTVERSMNYDLTVNASTGRLGEASDFAGHAVGFVEIDHSVGESDIDGAGLTFRIDSRRFEDVGMDVTDAVVYRYHAGHWNALPTTVVGRTNDSYVVRADSPGLSVFAVGLRDADLLSVTGASLSEPSAAVETPDDDSNDHPDADSDDHGHIDDDADDPSDGDERNDARRQTTGEERRSRSVVVRGRYRTPRLGGRPHMARSVTASEPFSLHLRADSR